MHTVMNITWSGEENRRKLLKGAEPQPPDSNINIKRKGIVQIKRDHRLRASTMMRRGKYIYIYIYIYRIYIIT
jgi:hypothetical protein